MERFINYIETALKDVDGGNTLHLFKRKTLDEMKERAVEVRSRGLKDETVVEDLIISEYPDLQGSYKLYASLAKQKKTTKRRLITNTVGSVIYLLALLVGYLYLSFSTLNWEKTWVLMVGGVLLWTVYILSLFIVKITKMRQIFHVIARILLAGCVMILSTVVFICSLEFFRFEGYWSIFIGGVAVLLAVDALYLTITKKKLAIFSYLLYIPIEGAMIYVILGALGVLAWNKGWLIIILSVIIDAAIILFSLLKNSIEKWEVVSAWKED